MGIRLALGIVALAGCASEVGIADADRTGAYAVAVAEACGEPCPGSVAMAMDWSDEEVRNDLEQRFDRTVVVGIPHNQQIDWLGVSEARLSSNGRALIVLVELVRGSDVRVEEILLVPEEGSWRVATPEEVDETSIVP